MSELIQKNDNGAAIRWKLRTSVSALALMVSSIGVVRAEDADHPLIWIELGAETDHITGQGNPYVPGFLSAYSTSSILQEKVTPLEAQNPPFSFGGEGKISFQPDDSNWVFSAAIRYGRSGNKRNVNHQTHHVHYSKYASGVPKTNQGTLHIFTQEKFADTNVYHAESHSIMDFQAGKDVGLGLFGANVETVLSGGVRIAQFASRSSVDMRARPDLHFWYFPSAADPNRFNFGPYFHTYHATENASRSFHGIGPSLSWNGSAPFVGNPQNGEITFDWGANAAILFGRQKASVHRYQTGRYWAKQHKTADGGNNYCVGKYPCVYHTATAGGHTSRRSIAVPNLGGFAGLSVKYQNAKVSIGYRADFLFGAMDVGIDARKSATLGFYGPFASVSVGIP